MAGMLSGDTSHHGMMDCGAIGVFHDKVEIHDQPGSSWYFSRKYIEENSPSRRDGIDLKKETYFRKSYCTFLQDLGMRLKVPQVTIATAIVFCHRFFLYQSLAKNDRRTIATVCMFLAGKVEETPHPLKDVILVSYEIIHKKDPAALQRIKQKEVYEQQKELILLGERLVLATLGFDLNVHHPYKPLVEAIKKFKVAQNALAQVAWNFVNDGLRTSLCLQFKPHHIAAGAIFLAAKFLKVKLPSDGEKVWWQEFDVNPRQLEEVSNQMLELYEQNRATPPSHSHGSEVDGSGDGANYNNCASAKTPEPASTVNGYPQGTLRHGGALATRVDNERGSQASSQNNIDIFVNTDVSTRGWSHKEADGANKAELRKQQPLEDGERIETGEIAEAREKPSSSKAVQNEGGGTKGCNGGPSDAIRKINKEKVKAALEKRKKSRGGVMARKPDVMDDYDLIERELENGVELAVAEDEKIKRGRTEQKSSLSMMPSLSYRSETSNQVKFGTDFGETGISKGRSESFDYADNQQCEPVDTENNTEEGELSSFDVSRGHHSPRSISRKRKAAEISPPDKEGRHDYYGVERDHHRSYRQEAHHV
ncbi:cyclin-T1-3-like [Aristolochia californica]|uniref:cyclin-T1-3-like n=1 Tax=Aristolochia californica TaxID=171875 RepID=UPI0035D6FEDD